ncbi:hypothetical protein Tco_0003992 [Tanacetum coccineum]
MESCAVGHFGAMAWHQANSHELPPLLNDKKKMCTTSNWSQQSTSIFMKRNLAVVEQLRRGGGAVERWCWGSRAVVVSPEFENKDGEEGEEYW